MGKRPSYKRKYEISHMWERHHEIVRRALLGQSNTQIAEGLGITTVTVSNALNSKIVRDKLKILRAQRDASTVDVAAAIKNLAPKCIEVIEGVLDSDVARDADKLRAAFDLLDRGGYAAPKVIKTENLHGVFTKDDLVEIKKQAMELAKDAENVIMIEASNE